MNKKWYVLGMSLLCLGIPQTKAGYITQYYYSDIDPNPAASSDNVSVLKNSPKFPAGFDSFDNGGPLPPQIIVKGWSTPVDYGDHYGGYIRGYVEAPETGNYVFYLRCDDGGEVQLSTDPLDPSKKTVIASSPAYAGNWQQSGNTVSAPIALVKGQKYYMETYVKESGGGDFLEVGWKLPSGKLERPIPARSVAPYPYRPDEAGTAPVPLSVYTYLPSAVTADENRPVEFGVEIEGRQPLTYKWSFTPRNSSTPVVLNPSDVNLSFLRLAKTSLTNAGTYSVDVTGPDGTINGGTVDLTIVEDISGPKIVGAANKGNPTGVNVFFNEEMDRVTAENKANWSITPLAGATITNVWLMNPTTVVVSASVKLSGGVNYTVTGNNVKDIKGNIIDATARSTNFGLGGSVLRRFFYDAQGGTVTDVRNNAKVIANQYDRLEEYSLFEAPYSVNGAGALRDNYASVASGNLFAPANGAYVFALAMDDHTELWMSTDETEAKKVRVAFEPQWAGARNYLTDGNVDVQNGRINAANFSNPSQTQANITVPISLVAGKSYYMEIVHRQGGGGDNWAMAWKPPGGADIVNGMAAMPATSFVPTSPVALGPVVITSQPVNVAVDELLAASFKVTASGSLLGSGATLYGYQWYKGSVAISGATNDTFTIPITQPADNNSTYFATVANGFSAATSSVVTLTVRIDVDKPLLAKAVGSATQDRITVNYSEFVNPLTATNAANYAVNKGVTVLSATLVGATPTKTVQLTTSAQTPNTAYTVTVNNVTDASTRLNVILPNSTVNFTSWVLAPGGVIDEYYDNIGGGSVADLTNSVKFINHTPDLVVIQAIAEGLNGRAENYGSRMIGQLKAPVTGAYTFFISGDDALALFLSTDESPANKVSIATQGGWANSRDFITASDAGQQANRVTAGGITGQSQENISLPVNLVAGKLYFFEFLHKEGGGGDSHALAWQYPGSPTIVNGSAPINGTNVWNFTDPDSTFINITTDLTNQTAVAGNAVTFRVAANGSSGVSYQWQRNGVDIAGATGNSYTISPVTAADNGAKFSVKLAVILRNAVSAESTLTVQLDPTPAKLVGSGSLNGTNNVTIVFDKKVDPATLATLANFSVSGTTVTKATLQKDGRTVILTTSSGVSAGYTVSVAGIKDVSGHTIGSTPVTGKISMPGFVSADIGNPAMAGSVADLGDGTLLVNAGGADIWGQNDQFHFVYTKANGNFDVVVQVVTNAPINRYAKAGLMVRESLNANSRNFSLINSPTNVATTIGTDSGNNTIEANYRPVTGGPINGTAVPGGDTRTWDESATSVFKSRKNPVPYPNAWLRLKREGAVITSFIGTNGTDWTQFESVTLTNDYPAETYVGLVVTSHDNGTGNQFVTTAEFKNFVNFPYIDTGAGNPVSLSASVDSNGQIVLSWPTASGMTLQASDSVKGTYTTFAGGTQGSNGANTTVTLTSSGPGKFFRLKK